jgi:glycogen(starch) synthase
MAWRSRRPRRCWVLDISPPVPCACDVPTDPAHRFTLPGVKVLMISRSDYEWDVRVRREARALASAGHEVSFVGLPSNMHADGPVRLMSTPSGSGRATVSRSLPYRMMRWLLLPEHRQRVERRFATQVVERVDELALRPDVVHAHDYPALVPAARIADSIGALLVYDSHEFWTGRPRRGRPEPFRRRRTLHREAELAQRADAVIMVSDHGAALMEETMGLSDVSVIRNTFPRRSDLGAPEAATGAVYAGRIAPRRDLETVFSAPTWKARGLTLHLMGEVDDVEIPGWAQLHAMGTMEQVEALLSRVGIGLVTMTNTYVNHRIALPNKLFQSISVGVPVVATNAPQTAEVVSRYGIGALYEPGDPLSFDAAIASVLDGYPTLVANVADAQSSFDWSVDSNKLVELYQRLESNR